MNFRQASNGLWTDFGRALDGLWMDFGWTLDGLWTYLRKTPDGHSTYFEWTLEWTELWCNLTLGLFCTSFGKAIGWTFDGLSTDFRQTFDGVLTSRLIGCFIDPAPGLGSEECARRWGLRVAYRRLRTDEKSRRDRLLPQDNRREFSLLFVRNILPPIILARIFLPNIEEVAVDNRFVEARNKYYVVFIYTIRSMLQ